MYSRGKTEWFVQEAFQQMLEKYHLKEKYIYSWKTLVGNMIHKHTKKITLKNKILTIIIDSPIVKNELRMLRTELLLRIKENVPLVDIDEIIIK
jgi:predicted nucleic acid-binding Zn ribbon protein